MSEQPLSEHFGLKAGDRVYVNGERVDNGPRLADVIADADPVALDNIHTEWARESIARTILESAWLAAHDEGVRAAERERLAAAWEEVDGPDRVRRPPFRPFHWTTRFDAGGPNP